MLNSYGADFLVNLAASLAYDLIKSGRSYLSKLAFGDEEARLLGDIWKESFEAMLLEVASELSTDQWNLVDDLLRDFIKEEEVVELMLDLALKGQEPSRTRMRHYFRKAGYDPKRIEIDFDQAMDSLIHGLAKTMLKEAKQPDSALHNRVNIARLEVIRSDIQVVIAKQREHDKKLDVIADAVSRSREAADPQLKPEELRWTYLQELIVRWSPQIDVLDIGKHINLPVEISNSPADWDQRKIHEYESLFAVPTSEMPDRFVIVGGPGSGKTTTMQALVVDSAKKCLDDASSPIPVLVELWEWSDSPTFIHFLETYISGEYRLLNSIGDTYDLLTQKKIVLFLDGLDEVQDTKKMRHLRDWLSRSPVNVIATCREADFVGFRRFRMPVISIKHLEYEQVAVFAESYLGKEIAGEFLATLYLTPSSGWYDKPRHLLHLARTPFFLMLILAQFKDKPWSQSPNLWELLRSTINRLWNPERERVFEILHDHGLEAYADTSQIILLLARVALENIYSAAVDKKEFYYFVGQRLTEALAEAGLVQVGRTKVRFRHPLFAEFFAANELLLNRDLFKFARSSCAGALVMLASRSEPERLEVQEALLNAMTTEKDVERQIWALGEIGGDDAIPPIMGFYNNSNRTSFDAVLKAMARIAGRLPEDSSAKKLVLDTISELLLIEPEAWLEKSTRDYKSYTYFLLDVWGAAEAIAEIRSEKAAQLLLDALIIISSKLQIEREPMGFTTLKGFAACFARIGRAAAPILFAALNHENFHVTDTASQALAMMHHSIPLGPLHQILATHPSAVVRFQIAIILGHHKDSAAILHLIAALNDDGIWQQGGRLRFFGVLPTYFYVADSAAYALAKIGSEECINALRDRLYNSDGSMSVELLLDRITNDHDLDHENSLRTQWARNVAAKPGGLERLLPYMGHIVKDSLQMDPIAQAIIQRFDKSKIAPIEQIVAFLENSDDIVSRRWALIVLGDISDLSGAALLAKYMSGESEPALRSAAAGGMGVLVSRHISTFPDCAAAVENLLLLLEEVEPEYDLPGISLGISRISEECLEDRPEIVELILECLMKVASGSNRTAVINAINTLDAVFFALASVLPGFGAQTRHFTSADQRKYLPERLVNDSHQLVLFSPSYHMKQGVTNLNYGRYDGKRYIEDALKSFDTAREFREEKKPTWAMEFTEGDWARLGCDSSSIYFQMGQANYSAKRRDEALLSFQHCLEFLNNGSLLSQKHTWMLAKASLLSGYILFNDMERIGESQDWFSQAVQAGENLHDLDIVVDALLSIASVRRRLENWPGVIQAAERLLDIMDSDPTRLHNECLALLMLGEAQMQSGQLKAGSETFARVERIASRFGMREMLIEILFRRANLYLKQGDETHVWSDIATAVQVYETLHDWFGAAELLSYMADTVRETNYSQAIAFYKQALTSLNRIDSLDYNQAEAKAYVLRQLADYYEEREEFDEVEKCYNMAISGLRTVMEDNEISPALARVVLDYGRYLHRTSRTEEATSRVIQSFMMLALLNLNTNEAESALAEMNIRPDWNIPSGMVYMLIGIVTEALTVAPERTDTAARLIEGMIERARGQKRVAEEEFLLALSKLLQHQFVFLDDQNPYLEPYKSIQRNVTGFHVLNSNSELVGTILEWVGCKDWSTSRRLFEEHPELLSPPTEPVFETLIQGFEDHEDSEATRNLARYLELLRLCKELGAAFVYDQLEGPSDIMKAIKELGSAKGWEEARRILHDCPQLLSPEADLVYEIPIRIEQANEDAYREEILTMNRDLCLMAKEIGIDEAVEYFADPPHVTEAIKEFINAEDWDSARRVLESHPELLSPVADAELRVTIHVAQSEGDAYVESLIKPHRDLLHRCREIGIDAAFKELKDTRGLAQALIDFASAESWDAAHLLLTDNPRLLTQEADTLLMKLLNEAKLDNQIQAVMNLLLCRGLLKICKNEGLELAEEAFNWVNDASPIAKIIMEFVEAEDWETTARIVEEHPELLSPESEKSLKNSIRFAKINGDVDMEEKLQLHLDLIHLCQEVGVNEAIVQIKLQSRLSLIAHNTIAVLLDAPEEKEEWLDRAKRFLEDSEDPQLAILLESIIQLLNHVRGTQPIQELKGIYAECWSNITEGLAPRNDKQAFDRIARNTLAVMTNYPEGRDEWKSIIQQQLVSFIEDRITPNVELFEAILQLLNDHELSTIRPDLEPDSPHFACWASIVEHLSKAKIEPTKLSEKDASELKEADRLYEKALELKDVSDLHILKQALEQYADPAQRIYERNRSPHAQDALDLVNELDAKVKRLSEKR
jgi:tetratricopeptide (TPR) repeat protein/HEAT repeat protein